MKQLKKTAMLCAGLALSVVANPLHEGFGKSFFSKMPTHSQPQKPQPTSLAKRAAELAWKQTGTTLYNYYSSGVGDGNDWKISERDTTIYDAAGNEILKMSTRTQTGWERDSLSSLDSSAYDGNKLVENYSFGYRSTKKINYTLRYTYTYLDFNKAVASTFSSWDTLQNKWKEERKDTTFFSSPIPQDLLNLWDYYDNFATSFSLIKAVRAYDFNSATSSWELASTISKVDAECNPTTLVLVLDEFYEDIPSAEKVVLKFKSPEFKTANLAERAFLEKEALTGTYRESSKTLYTATGEEYYSSGAWDAATSSVIFSYKTISNKDSHGNDTLKYSFAYDTLTKSFKTNIITRYNRTYDANGNNTVTIKSKYYTTSTDWDIQSKEINTFAQVSTPVVYTKEAARNKNIAMVTAPHRVSFTGSNIGGLNLYNAAGRLVTTIKQQASPTIALNFNNRFSTGSYLAEVVYDKGKQSFPLVIGR